MEVKLPHVKNEVNLNTAMHLVTIATVLIGIGAMWSEQRSTNNTQDKWIEEHKSWHNERSVETRTREGATDQRLKALELAMQDMKSMDYRIAQNEKGNELLGERMTQQQQINLQQTEDVRNDLSALSTQVELSKQILLRLEAKQTGGSLYQLPPSLQAPQQRQPG